MDRARRRPDSRKSTGHNGVYIVNRDGSNERFIDFRQSPGAQGVVDAQFWWCGFAHYDSRFITFSGPNPGMSTSDKNRIYFAELNSDFASDIPRPGGQVCREHRRYRTK